MKPIQILMAPDLVRAVDREAKRRRLDRSKLVRTALTEFLARARRRELEERHRQGYERFPQQKSDVADWEALQAWPED